MLNKWLRIELLLLVVLTWTIIFPIWRSKIIKNPLDEPITISPPGYVDTRIHIPVEEPYQLELLFNKNNIPSEKIKEIVGEGNDGLTVRKGIPIPIHWEVYGPTGQDSILCGESSVDNSQIWSKDYVSRKIDYLMFGKKGYLRPGEYRFVARVLKDVPEYSGFQARIRIVIPPDGINSWQLSTIYWGGFLEPFIWIADFILVIWVVRKHNV